MSTVKGLVGNNDVCTQDDNPDCGKCENKWDPNVVSLERCRARCTNDRGDEFNRCKRVAQKQDTLCFQHVKLRDDKQRDEYLRPVVDVKLVIVDASIVPQLKKDFFKTTNERRGSKNLVRHLLWAQYVDDQKDGGRVITVMVAHLDENEKVLKTKGVQIKSHHDASAWDASGWINSYIFGHSFASVTVDSWDKKNPYSFRTRNTRQSVNLSSPGPVVWTKNEVNWVLHFHADACDPFSLSDCRQCKKSGLFKSQCTAMCKCSKNKKRCKRRPRKGHSTCWQHAEGAQDDIPCHFTPYMARKSAGRGRSGQGSSSSDRGDLVGSAIGGALTGGLIASFA